MNVVFMRFDHNLDYKSVVNSFYIKKFLENIYGEMPSMITPRNFLFDRDKLGEFIQDQYLQSRPFIVDTKAIPSEIDNEYHKNIKQLEREATQRDIERVKREFPNLFK